MALALTLSGGIWLMFSLGAWSTLGQLSPDLLLFSGHLLLSWFLCVFLQLCALQWLRVRCPAGGGWVAARFALILIIGLTFISGPLSSRAYSARLGLTLPDTSWLNLPNWVTIWLAVFLIVRDQGLRRQAVALERLQQLQAAQIASRRRMVESQLRALQARIDPQLFFDLLDAVERLYTSDGARAEALLDELIVFLRAALPRLHSNSSCLAQELALVQSYVRAQRLARDDAATLEVDIAEDIQDLAFPAGVLLPLLSGIDAVLPPAARLHLTASISTTEATGAAHPGALNLTLDAPAAIPVPLLEAIRRTLHALHGEATSVTCTSADGTRFHQRLSVPLETA